MISKLNLFLLLARTFLLSLYQEKARELEEAMQVKQQQVREGREDQEEGRRRIRKSGAGGAGKGGCGRVQGRSILFRPNYTL